MSHRAADEMNPEFNKITISKPCFWLLGLYFLHAVLEWPRPQLNLIGPQLCILIRCDVYFLGSMKRRSHSCNCKLIHFQLDDL